MPDARLSRTREAYSPAHCCATMVEAIERYRQRVYEGMTLHDSAMVMYDEARALLTPASREPLEPTEDTPWGV